MTPILLLVAAEQKSTTRAGPSNLGQYPGALPLHSSSQVMQGQPSTPTDGPFTAELEVIQQRSQNTGPYNIPSLHDPAVRHREERVPQRPASARVSSHDPYGTASNSENRQDMVQHLPHEACKIKLATYDGQEDWDSFCCLLSAKHTSLDGLVQSELIDFMSAFVELLSTMSAPCQNISVKTIHSSRNNLHSVLE